MIKKTTILKITLGVLAVPAFLAAVFVGYTLMISAAFTSGDIPHKSDEDLIANFQAHKADFNRMLQMINEDKGLERVDYYWTHPENPQTVGISLERIDEYRSLFRRAGVPRGFSAFQTKDHIEFIASARGLAVSGSSKGYIYSTQPLTRVVNNLDTYQASKDRPYSYPVYRHIEGNWYLFFEAN